MRMIDALVKLANGEIKEGTLLKIVDEKYDAKQSAFKFSGGYFYHEEDFSLEGLYSFDANFFNRKVELTLPEEKKYLVHINLLSHSRMRDLVFLSIIDEKGHFKNHFTKSELQSIRSVRDYLEVIQGNYELIEVTDDEND